MTPMEAYSVISRVFYQLALYRQEYFHNSKGYSKEEVSAQVIAFEALRRMEEEGDEHEQT